MNIKLPHAHPTEDNKWIDVQVDYEYQGLVDFIVDDELIMRIDPALFKQIGDAIWWENEEGYQRGLMEDLS
jgi:hypothetical protein